jgi:hypothetical protein
VHTRYVRPPRWHYQKLFLHDDGTEVRCRIFFHSRFVNPYAQPSSPFYTIRRFVVVFPRPTMSHTLVRRVLRDWASIDLGSKISVASTISNEGFRSDTLFKQLCRDILDTSPTSAIQPHTIASVLVSMGRLKMSSGKTEWWDRERDYQALVASLRTHLSSDSLTHMSVEQLADCLRVIGKPISKEISDASLSRLKQVLDEGVSEENQSQRLIADIIESLSSGKTFYVSHDNQLWLAEWLCANVYLMTVHDVARINRCLAKVGFRGHNYHKIWVPYYLERLGELGKDDIAAISETFNSIGMSDTLLGGRHFFYKLGKRFQELVVSENGDKQVNQTKKYRNLLQRLG